MTSSRIGHLTEVGENKKLTASVYPAMSCIQHRTDTLEPTQTGRARLLVLYVHFTSPRERRVGRQASKRATRNCMATKEGGVTRGTVNSQHTHTHTHTLVIIRMYAHRSFSMRIGHPPLRYAYLLFLRSLRSQSGFGWDRHVGPLPARPPFSSRASIRVDGKKRETKGGDVFVPFF